MEDRNDEFYMRRAIELALMAQEVDEVPVGAVAVRDGEIIAEAYNTRETTKCATHHAEVLCIERACAALGGWRLIGCDLYVTLEPCPMCAGAIVNSRIESTRRHRYSLMSTAESSDEAHSSSRVRVCMLCATSICLPRQSATRL